MSEIDPRYCYGPGPEDYEVIVTTLGEDDHPQRGLREGLTVTGYSGTPLGSLKVGSLQRGRTQVRFGE